MNKTESTSEYDVVIVGSGTCGATLARELAGKGLSVVVLEQGRDRPLKDNLSGILSVAKEYSVGPKLKATCAVTAGGSTSLYFGVCKLPNRETFEQLGIDLSAEFEQVMQELPIAELPEEYLTLQSKKFRDSAAQLGYPLGKRPMLIDQSKCTSTYSYEAKWKARDYLYEAVSKGVELVTNAKVNRVLVEGGKATGVEYTSASGFLRSSTAIVRGKRVVLCAGAFGTPRILMDCGIPNVGSHGFFCTPGFMMFGTIPGMHSDEGFLGSLETSLEEGVTIGDAPLTSAFHKLVMLGNFKLQYLFARERMISTGILLSDTPGGEVRRDGSYHKILSEQEMQKLARAEVIGRKILVNAGAENVFKTALVAGIPGGILRVGEHLDKHLQTALGNLYVCDHSVINDSKSTPTVTLVCLGKYLAKHLNASLREKNVVTQRKEKAVAG